MKNEIFLHMAEDLWIEMYERDFVELEDVTSFQRWMIALQEVGHTFTVQSMENRVLSKAQYNFNVGNSVRATVPDLPTNCKQLPRKTFWDSDIHNGCRVDTPSVLSHLGQNVLLAGHRQFRTPYPFVFDEPNISIVTNLSDVIQKKYRKVNYDLKQSDIDANYQFFKHHSEMSMVDAFICQFPAAMCQLWMPFNKSIMIMPAHR